jgi:hypothetical protein
MAGEGRRPRPHVHGVESSWRSKFWAFGDETMMLTDDDFAASVLVNETLEAGLSMEQLHQAEDELSSHLHNILPRYVNI